MLKSKLFKFLTALSPDEFKGLGRFLGSRWFNTDPNLKKLYAALASRAPVFAAEELDRRRLFTEVFPGATWDDGKWRNLASKFVKALERYFVQLEMELDEVTHRRLLAQVLGRKNLYRDFEREQQALIDELEAQPVPDLENLRKAMLLRRELYQYPLASSKDKQEELVVLQQRLEIFYEGEKMRLACDQLTLQRMHGRNLTAPPVPPPPEPVFLQLYRLIHELLANGTEQDFHIAKQFLMENMEKLSPDDQKIGLLQLQNFAIGQLNQGHSHFNRMVFDLYRLGFQHQILFENGVLTRPTFLNPISAGLQVGEFNWVWDFIASHHQFLHPEIQVEIKTRGIAEFHFQKGAFEKVIDTLAGYHADDLSDLIAARTLLLRSYFELFLADSSHFGLFNSYADSFLKFVSRKGLLAKSRKEAFSKFIKYLRKIAKLKYDNKWTKKAQAACLAAIEQEQNLTAKNWLLQKINML